MIFRRALLNELVRSVVAVFLVLLAITLVTMTIRLLGDAARGAIQPDTVLAFIGFRMLHYLPVVLALTLFISVLMTLTRSYRDNEMAIWFTSGLSLAAWIRPVVLFITPVIVCIAIISLYLGPWAERRSDEYRQQIDQRNELTTVTPGVFRESRQGRVYFVESLGANRLGNIFVQSVQNGRTGVMVAQQGFKQDTPNGEHFLILENGRRYEGVAGAPDYRVAEFERYALRMDPGQSTTTDLQASAMPTLSLLEHPGRANTAELHWRIGQPLSALLLTLAAIPLSFVNPRAGRSMNLIVALLLYAIYNNVLGIVQAWMQQGKINLAVGLWPVHGVMLLVVIVLFWRRMKLTPFFRWRR